MKGSMDKGYFISLVDGFEAIKFVAEFCKLMMNCLDNSSIGCVFNSLALNHTSIRTCLFFTSFFFFEDNFVFKEKVI